MSNDKILSMMRLNDPMNGYNRDQNVKQAPQGNSDDIIICSVCRGTGQIGGKKCDVCNGSGVGK